MKNKILGILIFIGILLGLCTVTSFGAISANSKTVNSGDSVTITVSSSQAVGACTLKCTDAGGLSLSSSNTSSGQANGNSISISSSSGVTTLGTYTFKTPSVTSDTTYTVKFSATGMEDTNLNSIANSSTSAKITVKAPSSNNNTTTPEKETPTTKEPTFKSVNQTIYAKSSTNVRASYSTSSSAIGKLEAGESVTRIGIGDNGWSKVTYKGKTAYVYSSNITTTKPSESTVKTLSELTVQEGTITPEFNADTTKYTLDVTENVEKLTLTATASDGKSKVDITGNENFVIGVNTVKITVTAEDGTTRIYTIDVNKTQAQPIKLSTLNVTGIKLEPEFNPEVYKYTVNLEAGSNVTDLNIEATTDTEKAIVEIVGNENFVEGENVITIIVSSEDGTQKTSYQIIVNKPAATTAAAGIFGTPNDLTLYIILGALVLAIIVVIIILIVKLRKNKKSDINEDSDTGLYNFKFNGDVKDDVSIRYAKKPLTNIEEPEQNFTQPVEEEIFNESEEERKAQEEIEKAQENKINKKDNYSSTIEKNFDYTNGYRKPGNPVKGKHF